MSTTSLKEIREDPVIRRAFQIKESADTALDLEKIEREADLSHANRASRRLFKIALEPTSLAHAAMQDMANRARLSELKARIYVQKCSLMNAQEQCTAHLATRHREFLQKSGSTVADRKMVVIRILKPLVQAISEMDSTLELLEIYIKDIDSAAWALRNATEMLKLLMDNRGKVL